jgi:hypothetical protein
MLSETAKDNWLSETANNNLLLDTANNNLLSDTIQSITICYKKKKITTDSHIHLLITNYPTSRELYQQQISSLCSGQSTRSV